MCEAKPGPRCSKDTKKTLNKVNSKLEKLLADQREVQQELVRATNDYRKKPSKKKEAEFNSVSRSLSKVKEAIAVTEAKREEKELQYYATPEGMKSVLNLNMSPDYTKRLLKAASEYRKVQKYLLMKLNEANTVPEKLTLIQTFKEVISRNSIINQRKTELHGKNDFDIYESNIVVKYNQLLQNDLADVARKLAH